MVTNIGYSEIKEAIKELKLIKRKCESCKFNTKLKSKFNEVSKDDIKIKYTIRVSSEGWFRDKEDYTTPQWLKVNNGVFSQFKEHEIKKSSYEVNHIFRYCGIFGEEKNKSIVSTKVVLVPSFSDFQQKVKNNAGNNDSMCIDTSKINDNIKIYSDWINKKNDKRKKYNEAIDRLVNSIDKEILKLEKIIELYKNIDKSTQPVDDKPVSLSNHANLTSKIIPIKSGDKLVKKLNKAIKQLQKLGLSKKKIKAIIEKYAKSANLKITYKKTKSLSIKAVKNIKNSNSNKKNKQKIVTLVSAVVTQMNNKKSNVIDNIKIGTSNKIEQAKLNLNKKILEINNDRDTKIANIESKRDDDIANLYKDASDEINNIDVTDADAQKQINEINAKLEDDINSVKKDANVEIENVRELAEQQKAQANQNTKTEIEKIQNASNGEIKNIKENGLSKKTKIAKEFESAAKETSSVEQINTISLKEANINKENSTISLLNSKKEYNNNIAKKEQEIFNQASSVENNNDTTISANDNNLTNSNNSTETVATEVENVNNNEQIHANNQSYTTSVSENRDYSNNSSSADATSSISSMDEVTSDVESKIVETPAVPDNSTEDSLLTNNEKVSQIDDSVSYEILDTPKKQSKSSNMAIPIGLGVAAAGAATVAGVRLVKNRKQNEDIDSIYDDENNGDNLYESVDNNSPYMKDDYLGPSSNMYTDIDYSEAKELSDIPDDTKYTDAEQLEDDDFSVDEVLKELE